MTAATPVRAIVLTAGKGTRMKSRRPKVLHELCGRPMLWYTLRALRDAGVSDVIVVTSPENDAAIADGFGVRTVIQEPQRGTGHAVQIALDGLDARDGSILVAYGDMPLVDAPTFSAVASAQRRDGKALALITARMPLPSNFGRVIRSGENVERIVEARDATPDELAVDEMNAGIYAFDERSVREVIRHLSDDNAQRELYLTDTVALLIERSLAVTAVLVDDHRRVLGVNDRVELAQARTSLNARLCEEHMRAGVTIIDPATTYLEPDLAIEPDVTLYSNTTIGGNTRIGARAQIGPSCRLRNALIGEDAVITESVVLDSQVGERVSIGPFAHLRRQAAVAADGEIGNFVEIKNSELAAGVKAHHLAYLGDATIGRETNIGAGTITCNYDGRVKNRTSIGDNVFVGSNTSLVAPISLGDGSATGAGTVVIRDVPEGGRVVGNPARPLPAKSSA